MKTHMTAVDQCQASIAKQNLQAKASNYAKEQLLRLGRGYPMYNSNLTPAQNHKAVTDYSTLEASYIQEYITKHSAQKVSEQSQKEEIKPWARPYYDD